MALTSADGGEIRPPFTSLTAMAARPNELLTGSAGKVDG
jgi:hypothetical protein